MESEAPPLDKDLYRERLLTFKRFGFNFIRLHSHFEASEYMDTAAEVGILLSPALPMGAKNGSSHCARLDLAEEIYRRTLEENETQRSHNYKGVYISEQHLSPWPAAAAAPLEHSLPTRHVLPSLGPSCLDIPRLAVPKIQ
jgi:hypothetical protein